jgi:hypothetical protein
VGFIFIKHVFSIASSILIEGNPVKRRYSFAILGIVCVIAGIQFIHPAMNFNPMPANSNISSVYPVPEKVQNILSTSCFDCHSTTANFPWYARVQPIGWWISHHVNDGREKLNFDDFGSLSPRRQYRKLLDIEFQISNNEMPLSSYTMMHRIAILSPDEREAIVRWCESLRDTIHHRFPPDSLN